MYRARIAEMILSLFTSRERAGSTVGDLMEITRTRGTLWFWSSVFRAALSHCWSDFSAQPSFMAGLAVRGLLLNLSLYVVWFVVVFAGVGVLTGLLAPDNMAGSLWLFRTAGWIGPLAVQFQTGRWIARRACSREMAACAAYLIIQTIGLEIIGEALLGGWRARLLIVGPNVVPIPNITSTEIMICNLVALIALLAGAIWVRSHPAKRATR